MEIFIFHLDWRKCLFGFIRIHLEETDEKTWKFPNLKGFTTPKKNKNLDKILKWEPSGFIRTSGFEGSQRIEIAGLGFRVKLGSVPRRKTCPTKTCDKTPSKKREVGHLQFFCRIKLQMVQCFTQDQIMITSWDQSCFGAFLFHH